MKGWLVITSHVWHQSFWGLKKPTKWWQICQVYKIYPHRNLNPWFHKLHHQLHCLCTISTKLVLMQPKLDVNDFNCRSQSERSSYKRKQRTSLICISIYSLLLSIFIIPSEDGRLMDRWSWEEGRDRLIIQQDFQNNQDETIYILRWQEVSFRCVGCFPLICDQQLHQPKEGTCKQLVSPSQMQLQARHFFSLHWWSQLCSSYF